MGDKLLSIKAISFTTNIIKGRKNSHKNQSTIMIYEEEEETEGKSEEEVDETEETEE